MIKINMLYLKKKKEKQKEWPHLVENIIFDIASFFFNKDEQFVVIFLFPLP